jgi:hypothetical protein
MATIKYNEDENGNKRIILKNGKVSCTCCECCMYPAQALFDELYTENDLPNSIDIINLDLVNELEVNRSGDQYFGTTQGYTYRIRIDPEFSGDWAVDVSFNGGPYGRVTEFGCLVNYPYPRPDPESSGLKDQFADTYIISGPISGTVTRESICVWSGDGLSLSNFGYRWRVNSNNKSGNQNTPVGSYAGGYSVS